MTAAPLKRPVSLAALLAESRAGRRFSVAEIEAIVQVGVIDEDERFELIGVEVVPLSPKGAVHDWIEGDLNRFLQRAAPAHLSILQETTLRLDPATFVEPDFCVYPRGLDLKRLDGAAVLLAIEVADSSLAYDQGRKIGVYAAFGVREVWVVDARGASTRLHRRLGAEGFADVFDAPATRLLTPTLAPELALRLHDLGVAPLLDESP